MALADNTSLSQKTARGSFWLLVFRVADQVLRLVRTVFLARLLSPGDFGLFGITLLVVSFLDTFSQSGFHHALVHKKEDIEPYLGTSFVVQGIRGLVLAVVLFLAAHPIAVFFDAPGVDAIARIIALAVLIQGLTNVGVVYLSKDLHFKRYFFYQISGTLADFAVSVVLAIVLQNVWALVWGFLAGAVVRCLVSYVVVARVPDLRFRFAQAKELFSYGKWVFGSNIVGFFMVQIDSFFVAKMSGVVSLGFYQMAYKIPNILGMEIVAGAMFPAYAKIQDDKEKLRQAYLQTVKLFTFFLLPTAGGIFVVAADFTKLFLGAAWLPSVWPMRMLTLATVVWTLAVISDYLFLAVGKPYLQAKWTSVKLVMLLVLLYPLVQAAGFLGASAAVLLGSLVAASGMVVEALRITECRLREFTGTIFFSFANAFLMTVVVYYARGFLPEGMYGFLLAIGLGVGLYALLTIVSEKVFGHNTTGFIKSSLRLLK